MDGKLFSFRITRPAAFRFQPGQFARLGIASGKGGIIWRAYSMVSASYDEYLEFFSIIVPDGAFTTRLAQFGAGDTLQVEKLPYGYLTTGRFVGGQDLWMLVCGNPQMLEDLRGVLTERGLRPDCNREPGHFAFENYW